MIIITKLNKKDFILSALAGFFVATLAFLTFINAGILKAPKNYLWIFVGAWCVAISLLCPLFLRAAYFLGKRTGVAIQAAKFIIVGLLNTFITLGVTNIFIMLTGINKGLLTTVYFSIAAVLSITNSFFWNKYWTFQSSTMSGVKREVIIFLIITLLSVAVLSLSTHILSDYVFASFANRNFWINVSLVIATVLQFIINFLGYKIAFGGLNHE